MNKEEAKERIQKQLDTISSARTQGEQSKKWRRDSEIAIEKIFGTDSRHIKEFQGISYSPMVFSLYGSGQEFQEAHHRGLESAKAMLLSMVDEIENYWMEDLPSSDATSALARIENLCKHFHLVAKQLRSRYENRKTLEIEDEYDVQDLLHALLKIDFDDVRPEEWTPSYAGKSARVDFLLKDFSIIVEVKKTRKGLGHKEIGDQLIIDISRYKIHPDCKQLVCFVYDPEGRIGNPTAIENDLKGKHNDLDVIVIIAPRGF
ncbi:MAG TPA: hypothetical protein PKY82_03490 [Pyrinomonadaceae bacterium]|nr:hypothetical protein [Pyrinomonadaceae bacterium]